MALDKIVLGGGCFWCIEAGFENVRGVLSVESGYAGGDTDAPDYRSVCTGTTGHAEVVRIEYDDEVIDLPRLLEIFFTLHDPTGLNRQGADVGTKYRSVIFYADDEQKKQAEAVITDMQQQGLWDNPIVTELSPLPRLFPAEGYHQGYYRQNSQQPYCRAVISPKLSKLRRKHAALLKS